MSTLLSMIMITPWLVIFAYEHYRCDSWETRRQLRITALISIVITAALFWL